MTFRGKTGIIKKPDVEFCGIGKINERMIVLRKRNYIPALLCVGMLLTTGCTKGGDSSLTSEESIAETTAPTEETTEDPSRGQTIFWLGDYDLNPVQGRGRSAALAMYEDLYDGKIEWIPCAYEEKYTVLSSRILGGDPVDMVSFDAAVMPDGLHGGLFQPLDAYLDFKDEIWKDMLDEIDMFAYQGSHYIVPYDVSDPVLLTYSRTMCEENGLEDPCTLYQDGKWDWDVFMEMMDTFVANNESRTRRYGIAGVFGQALVQSTGRTIVQFDGRKFTNQIADPNIEAAQTLMTELRTRKLCDTTLYTAFPTKGNVLFLGMGDWSLAASNAQNPDADLMIVPFPKMPNTDAHYLSGSFDAKMLVKNSEKGEAVAAYITCERLARTQEEFTNAAKERALEQEVSASGQVMGFVTEEQYDAISSYQSDIPMLFEFGSGMQELGGEASGTFVTRGVMNNLSDGLLLFNSTWTELREMYTTVIDDVLKPYNENTAAQ